MQSKKKTEKWLENDAVFTYVRTKVLLLYRIKSNEFANQTAIARQTLARVH